MTNDNPFGLTVVQAFVDPSGGLHKNREDAEREALRQFISGKICKAISACEIDRYQPLADNDFYQITKHIIQECPPLVELIESGEAPERI